MKESLAKLFAWHGMSLRALLSCESCSFWFRRETERIVVSTPSMPKGVSCLSTIGPQWHLGPGKFLAHCSQLQRLDLGFRNDWAETEQVFEHISASATFPRLKDLALSFIRCKGEHLNLFLSGSQDLRKLSLESLDVTGSISFQDTLELLQSHHHLETFNFKQIAQNARRLYLHSLGDINDQSSPTLHLPRSQILGMEFFDDFIDVCGPWKYYGTAEAWEGVSNKIGLLKDDIRISSKSYEPDHPIGGYHWAE